MHKPGESSMDRIAKLLALAACAFATLLSSPASAQSGGWQCVTYARTITNVSIRGNANTWWNQAAGHYERGSMPAPGAVLAFKSAPGMRAGHVAVVREILSPREVRIEHANWSRRGGVERDARAVDVSDAGDWSEVRVTYGRDLGTRVNPTFGFIYPGAAEAAPAIAHEPKFKLGSDVIQLAMLER